ncbi:MAG: spore coat protein [Bacillota bacterium]
MPNLTQAELMQLREDISAEMLMIQKFAAYANMCNDQQVKQVITNVQRTHERHRDILMRHLMAAGQGMM